MSTLTYTDLSWLKTSKFSSFFQPQYVEKIHLPPKLRLCFTIFLRISRETLMTLANFLLFSAFVSGHATADGIRLICGPLNGESTDIIEYVNF